MDKKFIDSVVKGLLRGKIIVFRKNCVRETLYVRIQIITSLRTQKIHKKKEDGNFKMKPILVYNVSNSANHISKQMISEHIIKLLENSYIIDSSKDAKIVSELP